LSMNLSVAYAGVLMTSLLIGQAIQPLVGLVADKIGGRVFVIAGLVGAALGGALVGFMPNLWTLFVVLIAIGLCNSLFHPQAITGVRSIAGARPGMAMSVFLVGGEIGRGLWPLLASGLVMLWGLHAIWVLSIPAALTLLPLWHWTPSLAPRQRDSAPLRWRAHAGPLGVLVSLCSLRSLMLYSVITFMPLLWQQQGGALTGGASFITVLMLVGIFGNLGGGRLGDIVGGRPIVIGAMAASVLLLFGFILSSGLLTWLLLALLGITLFATLPLTVLIAQDILPENRSLGSGLVMGFANAIGAVCVAGLGPVASIWGAEMALWIALFCGLATIPLAIALPRQG